jgi:hypothetical protein
VTLIATLALAAGLHGGSGAPVKVALVAPNFTPKVNTHWNYTVRVTAGGKPVAAKLSEQIVDPLGGAHPVQLGLTKTNITNRPIKGTFRDFIIWPASSRGIPLTLRVTVTVGKKKQVLTYSVTPRG